VLLLDHPLEPLPKKPPLLKKRSPKKNKNLLKNKKRTLMPEDFSEISDQKAIKIFAYILSI
jgi:hypothetical protein